MRRRAVLRAGAGLAALLPTGRAGARSAAAYAPLGHRAIPGAADCRVSADGEVVYLANGGGFVSVSVADLSVIGSAASIEADREGGPLSGVADLALDGDRLLVPGPANHRPNRLAGFALFDVADPASPRQTAFYPTRFPIHNAALAGRHAYLTAGTRLVVVDVAGDEPAEVGRWSLVDADPGWGDVHPAVRPLHDVRVDGDLGVLSFWDAGTWLLDLRDPADPAVVGRAGGQPMGSLADLEGDAVRRAAVELPGNHHSAALSADGSLLAVGAEAFDAVAGDGEGGPGGIDLFDVSDPTAPAFLTAIDPPAMSDWTQAGAWTTAHDFAFDGDHLLSAWYQGGVRIHDVSDPAAPVELAWWRRPREVAFWTALPAAGETFVAPATTLPGGSLFSGLYRFPVRAGEQADPPSLTARPTDSAATPTGTPSGAAPTTSAPGQPGFGAAAAVAGAAGALAWRWRRSRRRSR